MSQPRLCARCSSLDLASVRSSTHARLPLGAVHSWHPDTCTLCGWLVALLARDPGIALSGETPYFLFSIKARYAPDKLFQVLDHRLVVLSAAENGPPPGNVPYIAAHRGTAPPAWLAHVQPEIDFERVKGWLGVCAELHGENCSGGKAHAIQNLRLIECATGQVVGAEEQEPYVALSYVWGEKEAGTQEAQGRYPATIQDAMVATQKLGFRWLWVDKYCIDQGDPDDLDGQLQQMDVIYQQAAVTIVAAAGTNAHYGLPGVGGRVRNATSAVRVGEELLCAIPKPELRPDNCRWASRAWTYQEGLLSRRRLVFTDDQVYFECHGCHCAEMLRIPVESFRKMHAAGKPWLSKRYRAAGRMGQFPLNGYGVFPWDIYSRIGEYSARSLSNESDILNGILGIFRAFQGMPDSTRHLHGIPFPSATSRPNETKMDAESKKFVLPTFAESLRWDLAAPSKRRKWFPSWSWAGWYGRVTWPAEYTDAEHARTARRMGRPRNAKADEKALEVCVELHGGETLSWAEMQTRYDALLARNEPCIFLNIEAYATPVSYSRHPPRQFLLRLAEGSRALSASITTAHEPQPHDTFLAIHTHRTVKRSQRPGSDAAVVTQHLLIVQHMESHWERVALGSYVVDPERKVPSTWQRIRLG